MEQLANVAEAEIRVLGDVRRMIADLRESVAHDPATLVEGIDIVQAIRESAYEDINQLQHEHLILAAIRWLETQGKVPPQASLFWNPRQTGGSDEPDLEVRTGGIPVISAEVTASPNPVGKIDERMATTLAKLSFMQGQKFYFVRTASMETRALTKIGKGGWTITVVKLG